jgi:hypothetical protein
MKSDAKNAGDSNQERQHEAEKWWYMGIREVVVKNDRLFR